MQNPACPVCLSPHTLLARTLIDVATREKVELYFCISCRSECSPNATPVPPHSALEWHLSVSERNIEYSLELFKALEIQSPFVLDVGCGSGTLLDAARSIGGGGIGFDIDTHSVAYVRSKGLDLRAETWTHCTPIQSEAFNLITCIMTLEHIHHPRPLLAELIRAGQHLQCPVFVSVPFLTRDWWRYLHEDLPNESHPFTMPRVHVTHFPLKALNGQPQISAVRIANQCLANVVGQAI